MKIANTKASMKKSLVILSLLSVSVSPAAFAKAKMARNVDVAAETAASEDSEIAKSLKEAPENIDTLNAKLVVDGGNTAPAAQIAPTAADAAAVSAMAPAVATGVQGEASIALGTAPTAPSAAGITAPLAKTDAKEVAKLPENQIPIMESGASAKKAGSDNLNRIMLTLAVLVVGLCATLFGLKRWAKKKGIKGTGTKIQILTQHPLGPKKNLFIVQVAGESILIGVTDHNISMLKTLSLIDDEVPTNVPNHFESALSDYEDHEMARESRVLQKGKSRDAGEQEDFTMRGLSEIRDTVSTRLRNMKNF